MKTLVVLALCFLAFAFADNVEEKQDNTLKVPVLPYPGYYYPYAHYYQGSHVAKPVSSYSYSYGNYYYPNSHPYKYVVPSYVPVQYYP